MSKQPLKCRAARGAISISIGNQTLKHSAAMHPEFWDGETGPDVPNIKVTNAAVFAKEVVRQINREDEDGSTLLTRMFDEAMKQAVENGCEGVDHEEEE